MEISRHDEVPHASDELEGLIGVELALAGQLLPLLLDAALLTSDEVHHREQFSLILLHAHLPSK